MSSNIGAKKQKIENMDLEEIEEDEPLQQSSQLQEFFGSLTEVEKKYLYKTQEFTFVNREDQIIGVIVLYVETLWNQLKFPTTWMNKYAIFTDQMFGSGKTYFGTNLIQKSRSLSTQILEKLKKMAETVYQKYQTEFEKFSISVLEKILNIETVQLTYDASIEKSIQERLELSKRDLFFHIDELCGVEDEVRRIWSFLNHIQQYEITKNRVIVYYFSGKNTLMNLVS